MAESSSSSASSSRVEQFKTEVDAYSSRLIDAYRAVLSSGLIDEQSTPNDELLVATSVENIVFYSRALLEKINDLKVEYIVRKSSMKTKSAESIPSLSS